MPDLLISIAPSPRKKNFLGPHVVGQDLKSCGSVWLYGGHLDSVKMETAQEGFAWAHWPLQRLPHSGCCPVDCNYSLGVGLNGNSVLPHLSYLCAKPEVWCEEKDLPGSVLLRLISKQNAVSKKGLSKPKFWYWGITLRQMHNFFPSSPLEESLRKAQSLANMFSDVYVTFITLSQS